MNCEPSVNILNELDDVPTNYFVLISERIDHAFDAGANNVAINITEETVEFKDDGDGVTRDGINSMLCIAGDVMVTKPVNRRGGIRLRCEAFNAGNVYTVHSWSRDGHVRAEVNWRDMLASGEWKIHTPIWEPVPANHPTGTIITFSELRSPPGLDPGKLREAIALRFHPALVAGKTILLNCDEALAEPELI